MPRGCVIGPIIGSRHVAENNFVRQETARLAVAALLLYVMTASRQAIASPNQRFGQFFLDFFAGDAAHWYANVQVLADLPKLV